LLEFIPHITRRILDLGTGDGRLLALMRREHPNTEAVAIDFSPVMLDAAKKRFAGDSSVAVVTHNLIIRFPAWASLMLSSLVSQSIIMCTSASAPFTPRSTNF
jgi:SAM-dependent methyltransferase